jgi:hypothetical protein
MDLVTYGVGGKRRREEEEKKEEEDETKRQHALPELEGLMGDLSLAVKPSPAQSSVGELMKIETTSPQAQSTSEAQLQRPSSSPGRLGSEAPPSLPPGYEYKTPVRERTQPSSSTRESPV